MIKDFLVIEGYGSSINHGIYDMKKKVWKYLNDGWELQGGIEIYYDGTFYNVYQVIIKK